MSWGGKGCWLVGVGGEDEVRKMKFEFGEFDMRRETSTSEDTESVPEVSTLAARLHFLARA